MVALAGGKNAMLQYARQCMTEHTGSGYIMALEVVSTLRLVHPSNDADDMYMQALKMLGWMTPSGPERDWYLMEACKVQTGQ